MGESLTRAGTDTEPRQWSCFLDFLTLQEGLGDAVSVLIQCAPSFRAWPFLLSPRLSGSLVSPSPSPSSMGSELAFLWTSAYAVPSTGSSCRALPPSPKANHWGTRQV